MKRGEEKTEKLESARENLVKIERMLQGYKRAPSRRIATSRGRWRSGDALLQSRRQKDDDPTIEPDPRA